MSNLFQASRMTAGNCMWPTTLEIAGDTLIRRKRRWFTVDETRMHLSKVATVHVVSGVLFTDIRIESSGGGDDIVSHGHTKGDAEALRGLIEAAQTRLALPDHGR